MDLYCMVIVLLHCGFCHTAPNDIYRLYVPDPAEVNNLYVDVNNVNEYRDVAPLTQTSDELNVEETVKEVEELIKNNAKLPRLTRGEIIDIIENITKSDIKVLPNKTRADGQKSLMVMPFTVGSAQGDIKELYTRTPVTRIIADGRPAIVKPKKKAVRKRPTFQPIYFEDERKNVVQGSDRNETFALKTTVTPSSVTTSESTSQTTSRTEAHSTKNTRILTTKGQLKTTQSTTPSTITFKPIIETEPKPTRKRQKPQKYSNHRYPDDPKLYVPDNGIRVVDAPTLQQNQYDEYSVPYVISSHKSQNQHSGNFKSTTQKAVKLTTQSTMFDDIVPDDFKSVVKDLDILIKPDENNQYVAMYHKQPSYNRINESLPTYVTHSSPMTTSPIPDISNVADNLSPDMRDLLMNFGLLQNPNEKPSTSPPPTETFAQKAEINPESYLSFKPLPADVPTRDDMDEFLSRFGLGRNSARSQKSISMGKSKKESGKLNLDAVPNSLKDVVKNLGFGGDYTNPVRSNAIADTSKHIFKPSGQNATKDELERLSKLLDMIKELDKLNHNVTVENLEKLDMKTLKDLIGSFNGDQFVPLDERDAPNPLNYVHKIVKNDFKRQENVSTTTTVLTTSSTTAATTTVAATTTTATTTTEEQRNPQLVDLEASFGGLQITTTETPVTTKRTGFYYLLDWNTFMEIDDQKGKRVNLRFQPHAGDPRNFLSVSVP